MTGRRTTIDAVSNEVRTSLEIAGVSADDAVVVACSGGADSTALADVAMRLAATGGLGRVALVYIDHGLRDDTALDTDHVERLAAGGGAVFRSISIDVDRDVASLEDAARRARYAALEAAASECGAKWILTAHTASDQAETVLLRILRGTGIAGLAGIPRRRGRIVRPLLDVPRELVIGYLAEQNLAFVEDPTNRDHQFARNRVRRDLLPRLRGENPQIDDALCRLARAADEQREVLDNAAAEVVRRARGDDNNFDVGVLVAAPAGVAKQAMRLIAEENGCPSLEARHLDALLRLLRRRRGGSASVDLPGLKVVREYDSLAIRAAGIESRAPAPEVLVEGPRPPYEIRRWRAGDRMRPQRLKGRSKKLSDLFGEAQVPRAARPQAIVVVCSANGAIEWAEHLGPAWQSQVVVTLV